MLPGSRLAGNAGPAYPCRVRLVSLLPSATEIVYALGLGDDLVGVTSECDEPAAARTEKTIGARRAAGGYLPRQQSPPRSA